MFLGGCYRVLQQPEDHQMAAELACMEEEEGGKLARPTGQMEAGIPLTREKSPFRKKKKSSKFSSFDGSSHSLRSWRLL